MPQQLQGDRLRRSSNVPSDSSSPPPITLSQLQPAHCTAISFSRQNCLPCQTIFSTNFTRGRKKLDLPSSTILYTAVNSCDHLSFDRKQTLLCRCAPCLGWSTMWTPQPEENHVLCCSPLRRMCVWMERICVETCLHRAIACTLLAPADLTAPPILVATQASETIAWILNVLDPFAELRCFKVIAAIVVPSLG